MIIMPSWQLHKKWAEKIGLDVDLSSKIDRIIDENGADLRGLELLKKLSEEGLNAESNNVLRAVILHNVLDCIRDIIWELGKEPVSLIPPSKILDIAYGECIDRNYIILGRRPNLSDLKEVIAELEPFSDEVVADIISELESEGLHDVGPCRRINEKYVRWLINDYPGLEKYEKEFWRKLSD